MQSLKRTATRCHRKSSRTPAELHRNRSSRCGYSSIFFTRRAEHLLPPQMPAHVLTVHQPSDASNELIAKKVRRESHELKILRLLHSIQPKSENVISLLDSFGSSLSCPAYSYRSRKLFIILSTTWRAQRGARGAQEEGDRRSS